MTAVPEKLRTGLLELRTPLGSVYVTPSFWQRVYLVWTFRNFRTLPKQVLNRRQQHVIEDLCRAHIVSRSRPLGTSLIGAVENVAITDAKPATPRTATVAEVNVVPVPAPTVQQETRKVVERCMVDISHVVARGRLIGYRGAKHLARIKAQVADGWRKPRIGLGQPFTWALLASAVALLGALTYFHNGRAAQRARTANADTHGFVSPDIPRLAVPATQHDERAVFTGPQQTPLATVKSAPRSSTIAAPNKGEASGEVQHAALRQPLPIAEDALRERLEIVGPPQAGFGYPEAPNPNLTGRVDLKAVIAPDGTVKGIDVLSGNRALAAAAARAVRLWRYRPPEVNGHAVEAETNIVISFVGDDAVSVRFPSDPQSH